MLHKVSIVPAKPDEEDKAGSEVAAMFNGIQPGNVEGGEKDMPFWQNKKAAGKPAVGREGEKNEKTKEISKKGKKRSRNLSAFQKIL